jgi:hypothetical protein
MRSLTFSTKHIGAALIALTVIALMALSLVLVLGAGKRCPMDSLEVGVVSNDDRGLLVQAGRLGAHVVRVEFDAATATPEEFGRVVALASANHVRLQPLVGWDAGRPPPDLTFVAEWARRFGPGGTGWHGAAQANPITDIELGNENAFSYKSGDPRTSGYRDLARKYGERVASAARAVRAANPAVGVLAELERGDSGAAIWMAEAVRAGGEELTQLIRGVTVHAYGPDWRKTVFATAADLQKVGVRKPIYMTEWGIATDDGRQLDDNYGWPKALTYATAAEMLGAAVGEMEQDSHLIRQVLLYQIRDQRPPGTGKREDYFGLTRWDGSDKGALTIVVRSIFDRYSCGARRA